MSQRAFANAAAFAVVIWLNGLAGSGSLSGESIGILANRYPSAFLPANYVFGIWGLIYASLAAFVLYQFLARGADGAVTRIGWWWVLSCVLNVAWIVTFAFSRFAAAMVLMAALLAVLAVIHVRVGRGLRPLRAAEHAFVAFPFSLYLAWIGVAVIANGFQYGAYLGWLGTDGGAGWAAVMMVVATAGAAWMVRARGDWVFPCVTAWAFLGIADRYPDLALLTTTAYLCTAAGFLGMIVALALRRARAVDSPDH